MNWKKSYNHLMSGVSYFLSSAVGGGIMLTCAYLFDFQNANTAAFGSSNVFVSWLSQIGGLAVGHMSPIMGAYIAYSMADRLGLLTGMVAGALAASGGSNFLGAMIGGLAADYIILGLKKLTTGIPRSLKGIKILLLLLMLGLALTSLAVLAVSSVVVPISNAFTDFLSGLSGTSAALLGVVIDGMLTLDLGGLINKAACLFFVATLTTAGGGTVPSVVVASCDCSTMVIATSYAVICTLFPKGLSENLQGVKITAYIIGFSLFVEGAVLFAADRPKKVLPSLCIGAAVAGALVAMFGTTLSTPIDGLEALLLTSDIPSHLLSSAIGTAAAVYMIYFFIGNEPDQE